MSPPDHADVARRLIEARREFKELVTEGSLMVAGTIDPSPFADLAAATMAFDRGDYWGAALDLLSTMPYGGDLVAKPIAGVHVGRQLAALRKKIEMLVQQMSGNPGLRAAPKNGKASIALTDEGVGRLARDLPLPRWATDFSSWRNKRVIDAGAGGGTFVRELRAQGIDATGVDLVADTFKKAGIRHNDHFVQATAERLPMPDNTFDAGCSNWSVFYYFERRHGEALTRKYLDELVRVVKSGGEIRLFGVDPRAAAVIGRSQRVRVVRTTPPSRGTIPVMILQVARRGHDSRVPAVAY